MNRLKNVLLLFLFLSHANAYEIQIIHDTTGYSQQKKVAKSNKAQLLKQYTQKKITLDSVGKEFEKGLVNKIIPYWYGLPWTFEGHTNSPDSGTIACGYFVSTTLKHFGLNVNRYKLAQQSAQNEVRTLALDDSLVMHYVWSDSLTEQLKAELPKGLYMAGLDNHVGYVLNHSSELYFIHSTYLEPTKVVIELVSQSEAWHMSAEYYITPISNNAKLMKYWLKNTPIPIKK